MDDRDSSIAKDLKAAEGFSGNSKELNEKAEEIISDAKAKAAAIREKAIETEKELSASKVASKQGELDKEYAGFIKKLASDKESLKSALLSQMPLFKESLKAKFNKL
jgi:F-type H+-transporting ATPase subunit b